MKVNLAPNAGYFLSKCKAQFYQADDQANGKMCAFCYCLSVYVFLITE